MITIGNITIHESSNGLYSLNDLHKASGKRKAKQPSDFMRLKSTNEMISALIAGNLVTEQKHNVTSLPLLAEIPGALTNQLFITVNGDNGGTFACKDLAYAYAMWLSPQFYILVIRTFDAVVNAASPEELAAVKDKLAWATGELRMMEHRQPKDKRSLSSILGIASSQVYPYFKYLVGIGELEQVTIPQPDKVIYRPTQQAKTVIGQKGATLLFDDSVKRLIPTQTDWNLEGAL